MNFSEFFRDGSGQLSMTRLCTFVLIISGSVMAFIYPDYETGYLGLVTLGLGGKVGQKIVEGRK